MWSRVSEPLQGLCLQGGLQDTGLPLPGIRYLPLPFAPCPALPSPCLGLVLATACCEQSSGESCLMHMGL